MALALVLVVGLTACEVEGVYKPRSTLSHGPVSVQAPNEYGGYAGVTLVVTAKDKVIRVSCANSRLAISRTIVLPPLMTEEWRCTEIERDLAPGENISLRFLFPASMLKNGELFSRNGQPKKIDLLLQTYQNEKWSTLTYTFKLDQNYRVSIPFSKG